MLFASAVWLPGMTPSMRYTDTSKYSQLYKAARCIKYLCIWRCLFFLVSETRRRLAHLCKCSLQKTHCKAMNRPSKSCWNLPHVLLAPWLAWPSSALAADSASGQRQHACPSAVAQAQMDSCVANVVTSVWAVHSLFLLCLAVQDCHDLHGHLSCQ